MTRRSSAQGYVAVGGEPETKRRAVSDRRLLIAEIGLPLLLLALLEIGLRVYAADPASHLTPAFFADPVTTYKYLAYRRLVARERSEDVVFFGTSQNMRIDMRHLRETFRERDVPLRAFNFGAPAHWVGFDRRLLGRILIKIGKPAAIVYGVMPLNLLWENSETQTDSMVRRLPAFSAYDGTPAGMLRGALLHHVALIEYGGAIRARLTGEEVARAGTLDKEARLIGEFGDAGNPPLNGR